MFVANKMLKNPSCQKIAIILYCALLSFVSFGQSNLGLEADSVVSNSGSIEKQLRDTISLWGGAWAAQIPGAYFEFYSERYIAPGFESREEWMEDRRRLIEEPDYIRIRLLDFELVNVSELLLDELLAVTRFTLLYERPGYGDRTYKELELMFRSGEWKIVSEKNLRVELNDTIE